MAPHILNRKQVRRDVPSENDGDRFWQKRATPIPAHDDVDLTPEQRQLLSDKLPDAANVALGALVFGPLLGSGSFSIVRIAAGSVIWVLVFGFCLLIGRRQ